VVVFCPADKFLKAQKKTFPVYAGRIKRILKTLVEKTSHFTY